LKAVISNGAVSPAMRAIARNAPVMIAGSAAGTDTRRTVCQWCAPRAWLALRRVCGTSFSASSEERMTIGIIMTARANAPARAENWRSGGSQPSLMSNRTSA
jgi:hypothetical protein